MATAAQVTALYESILGRPPDPAGLAYYTSGAGAARGLDQIAQDFNYAVATGAERGPAPAPTPTPTPAPTGISSIPITLPDRNVNSGLTINTGATSVAAPTTLTPQQVIAQQLERLAAANPPLTTGTTTPPPGTTTPPPGTTTPPPPGGGGVTTSNADAKRAEAESLVRNAYQQVFNRAPDQAGFDFYVNKVFTGEFPNDPKFIATRLAYGATGNDQILANLWGQANLGSVIFPNVGVTPPPGVQPPPKGDSPAGDITPVNNRQAGLTELYRAVFGRDPDPAGLNFYMEGGGKDIPLSRVSELFRGSPEFAERFPKFDAAQAGLFPTQFTFPTEQRPPEILGVTGRPTTGRTIADLYQRFLGREPDPAGLQFYAQKFGPTITQQGVSDFIGDIYGPRGEVAGLGGILPQGAFNRLATPPTASEITYGDKQYVSPFGIRPSDVIQDQIGRLTAEVPGGKAGGLVAYKEGGMPKLSAKEAGSQFDISEYIDPETGRFYINEFQRDVVFNPELREAERVARERMAMEEARRREELASGGFIDVIPSKVYSARVPIRLGTPSYAKGGLASIAENLAEKGRGGDTMLVHMAPEEVSGLRSLAMQMGGDLSINPQTGLPEAKFLKKLFKTVAPMLPFLIPGIGSAIGALGSKIGLGALASKSIAAGLIGGFTAPGKGFNFKEGLKTGIMAYGGGKLMEGLQAAGQAAGPTGGTATEAARIKPSPIDAYAASAPVVDPSVGVSTGNIGQPQPTYFDPSSELAIAQASAAPPAGTISPPAQTMTFNAPPAASSGPDVSVKGVEDAARGVKNIFTGGPEASAAFTEAAGVTPTTALTLGTTGYGLMEGDRERESFKAAQAARDEEERKRRRRFDDVFAQTLGRVPMAAGGGMVAFADGGMPTFEYGGTTAPTGEPRMVKGAGDGMSDNVPANIEGVQEARLANDEFVVPADVVADIGNGSSSAGAKKLYAMMDRIRRARHGTTEQPPEIDAERLMPA